MHHTAIHYNTLQHTTKHHIPICSTNIKISFNCPSRNSVYPFSSPPSAPFSSTSTALRVWREFDLTIPTALRKLVNMLRNENRNMSKDKATERRERER